MAAKRRKVAKTYASAPMSVEDIEARVLLSAEHANGVVDLLDRLRDGAEHVARGSVIAGWNGRSSLIPLLHALLLRRLRFSCPAPALQRIFEHYKAAAAPDSADKSLAPGLLH